MKRFAIQRNPSFEKSILIHLGLTLFIFVFPSFLAFVLKLKSNPDSIETVQVPVIVSEDLWLQLQKKKDQPESQKKQLQDLRPKSQKVFGLSRKALTENSLNNKKLNVDSVTVKQGNTVAKEMDDLKLRKTDEDSLPIPADDYLVTQGVKLLSSVTANRTDEARRAGYTGTALLMLLIDQKGQVRDVQQLNKLDFGLSEKAVEIAKKLLFSPAQIQNESVAVKIRFSIHFKSSN